jgi:hypothetical protein
MVIWYRYFHILVSCTKKNLATLPETRTSPSRRRSDLTNGLSQQKADCCSARPDIKESTGIQKAAATHAATGAKPNTVASMLLRQCAKRHLVWV